MSSLLILIIILVVAVVIGRFAKYTLREIRAINLGKRGTFNRRDWNNIPFAGMPISMAFTEVAKHEVYQKRFVQEANKFMHFAQIVDRQLDVDWLEKTKQLLFQRLHDPRELGALLNAGPKKDYGVLQAAFMYALLCSQRKGEGIKQNLMEGRNNQGTSDFIARRTDKEYFAFVNKQYPNLCQMISFLEPRKSYLMLAVIGYLITTGSEED